MHTNIKGVLRKKRGNLAIIVTIMVILPVVALSMGQILLASESFRIRTVEKTADRYSDFSSAEIVAYYAIDSVDGQYIDTLDISGVEEHCENKALAMLGKVVSVQIENNLEIENSIHIKVEVEATKNPVITIKNVGLIEIESEDPSDESVRYLIDCSGCSIERAVSYG